MSKTDTTSKQNLNESLSALMDGEANEMELRRILKSSDETLDNRWMRYHMVRDSIRNDFKSAQHMDFSASIFAAIADEPNHSLESPKKTTKPSIFSNIGRFAVAASVAGAVVIGVQFSENQLGNNLADTPTINTRPADVTTQPILGRDTSVRAVGNQASPKQQQPIVINESTQRQLKEVEDEVSRLMLEHAQNASQNTQQGVLPYVRVPETQQ